MTEAQIAWTVAFGGWGIAMLQYYLGYRERCQQREEDLLAKTLSYFEGRTQRRSIGISMVEGIWVPKAKHLDILVPVMLNQAICLLLSSDSTDAVHEERNLVRLYQLLKQCIPKTSRLGEYYPEILEAILRKDPEEKRKGIPLSGPTLRLWFAGLGGDVEQYDVEQPPARDK